MEERFNNTTAREDTLKDQDSFYQNTHSQNGKMCAKTW